MADPRFYVNVGPLTLGDALAHAGLAISADIAAQTFADVAAPDCAGPHDLIFVENAAHRAAAQASQAGFVITKPEWAGDFAGKTVIPSPTPQLHFIAAIHALYPPDRQPNFHDANPVSPHAVIAPDAAIHPTAVVAAGAEIGAGAVLHPHAVIGPGVVIGARCVIGGGAVISHSIIGDGTVVLPGARIGQDGFGFITHQGRHIRMPQLGRVMIGRDCEIGANATVDRGALGDTVLGDNVIVDNQVQIAHNVQVGRGAILVSQSGVAGSTRVGQYAVLAAQAGVADHLTIGDFAQIGAQAGVMRDVEPKARMMGSPAMPAREFFRQVSTLAKSRQGAKTSS